MLKTHRCLPFPLIAGVVLLLLDEDDFFLSFLFWGSERLFHFYIPLVKDTRGSGLNVTAGLRSCRSNTHRCTNQWSIFLPPLPPTSQTQTHFVSRGNNFFRSFFTRFICPFIRTFFIPVYNRFLFLF